MALCGSDAPIQPSQTCILGGRESARLKLVRVAIEKKRFLSCATWSPMTAFKNTKMEIENTHCGVSSICASESTMRSMQGLAWSFTMSLIHPLLHLVQTVFFFRSIRAAGHCLTCGLGEICSLKYDLPWNGGSLYIQASHKCSPLSASLR